MVLSSPRGGNGETARAFLRVASGRSFHERVKVLPGVVLTLLAMAQWGWGMPAPQSDANVVNPQPVRQGTAQPNSSEQGSQSPSQNVSQNPSPESGSVPPGDNPAAPDSPQVPTPSAQLPEPAIKNPEVRPAPKPAVAPPTLTIPRLSHVPALEDFLGMKPQGEIACRWRR